MRRFLFIPIFLLIVSCGPNQYIPKGVPDPLPPFHLPSRIRAALVLGSGGVRGMAHVGVIEELVLADIPIDLIVGCSAGSIVGAIYANHPNLYELIAAVGSIRSTSLLDIDVWKCRYGLSQGKTLNAVLRKYLGNKTFNQLKIPLIVVASDLHTGELIPIGSGNVVNAVQASCSIPFVFTPSKYMGRILVDGGVINPVPTKIAKDLGAEIIIAVDLCELLPKTYPSNLFEIATRSAEIAFMWQNQACTYFGNVIIRPKSCDVGAFNDDKKWQLYWAGRCAARKAIPEIKALLEKYPSEEESIKIKKLIHMNCYTPQINLSP